MTKLDALQIKFGKTVIDDQHWSLIDSLVQAVICIEKVWRLILSEIY